MSKYFVYHIPHPLHFADLSNGYIGVSCDPKRRFEEHQKSKYIVSHGIRKYDLIFDDLIILFSFDDSKEAYAKEHDLRPSPGIGWNITEGGSGFIDGHSHNVYSRAKMSASKKGKSNRQSDSHYKKLSELQKNIPRKKEKCTFCCKESGEGNSTRWHFGNCKEAPKQHTFINGFDCDGVITLGLRLGKKDVIITGRSEEERPETEIYLHKSGINNKIFMNDIPFESKTRELSGHHKVDTIWNLFTQGITIENFFEDDWIQMRIEQRRLKKLGLKTNVIWINHGGLTELENVRHIEE